MAENRVSVSPQENKPGENPLSGVVDPSRRAIVGKAEVRKLILGRYPFNVAQGDTKSLELYLLLQMSQNIIKSCI